MSLNIPRINFLADYIEALPPERFAMTDWAAFRGRRRNATQPQMLHDCGTVACIGGWTDTLFGKFEPDTLMAAHESSFTRAGGLLGLRGLEQAQDLFAPHHKSWDRITQAEAVAVLRRLAETGEVQWEV